MEKAWHCPAGARMILAITSVSVVTAPLVLVGVNQATRHERVLGALDFFFEQLRHSGKALIAWSVHYGEWVGVGVTALCLAAVIASVRQRKSDSAAIVSMATAISFLTWGELSLLADAVSRGCLFYAIGISAALIWGRRLPLPPRHSVELAPATSQASKTASNFRMVRTAEWPALVFLFLLAAVTRLYALTELPHEYESEMIISMLSSRTLVGLLRYIPEGIVANTNGIMHLLPQWVSFQVLGTSVFSLRFVSVACGLVCIALFYCIVRRVGGVSIAVVSTFLFVTAPEQLFWSRQENTPFQFVTLLALIVASAGLRMQERFSLRSMVVASATMPLARLFYGPAMVMLLYPPVLYAHGLLFSRAGRRSLLYGVPLLAAGVGAWIASLSTAASLISGQPWHFINPTLSAGAAVWRGEGTFREASLPELLRLQAANLAKNTAAVARAMTYQGSFSPWYRRADESTHPTIINAAMTVLLTLGLAYLLGQFSEPRAFALLVWVALAMLPALLSVDPVPRRMVGAFPAFYAIIAFTVGAILHQFCVLGASRIVWCAKVSSALALLLIAWANLASYFLLPMRPTHLEPLLAATKSIFQDTDGVYHNLGADWALLLAFGHGDDLFGKEDPPCYEGVRSRDWLHTALGVSCPFESPAMTYSLSAEQIEGLRARYDPQKISFLLEDRPATTKDVALLRALFPDSPFVELPRAGTALMSLHSLQVDRSNVDALRAPTLHPSASEAQPMDLAQSVMRDTKLVVGPSTDDSSVRIEGSLLIDFSGWFHLRVEPSCAAAEISVDGEVVRPQNWLPLTGGAHEMVVRLPSASACVLPIQVAGERHVDAGGSRAVSTPFVATRVASLPEARAMPVIRSRGYQEVLLPPLPEGVLSDFAVDEQGGLTLLLRNSHGYRIERLDAGGNPSGGWALSLDPLGISRAPDGTLFVPYAGDAVDEFSADGTLLSRWKTPWVRSATLGHLADGSILSALPGGKIALLDRNGREIGTWVEFEGEVKSFFEPWSAGANRKNDILIIQSNGIALQLHTPPHRFEPHLRRSFRIDFFEASAPASGWTFDEARDLIIVPDPASRNVLTFTLDGAAVMAIDPERDLGAISPGVVRRVAASANALYMLDGRQQLRKLVSLDRAGHALSSEENLK